MIRSLSAAGLMSTPNTVPLRAVENGPPTSVAAPLAASTVYSLLSLDTPYSFELVNR